MLARKNIFRAQKLIGEVDGEAELEAAGIHRVMRHREVVGAGHTLVDVAHHQKEARLGEAAVDVEIHEGIIADPLAVGV